MQTVFLSSLTEKNQLAAVVILEEKERGTVVPYLIHKVDAEYNLDDVVYDDC